MIRLLSIHSLILEQSLRRLRTRIRSTDIRDSAAAELRRPSKPLCFCRYIIFDLMDVAAAINV